MFLRIRLSSAPKQQTATATRSESHIDVHSVAYYPADGRLFERKIEQLRNIGAGKVGQLNENRDPSRALIEQRCRFLDPIRLNRLSTFSALNVVPTDIVSASGTF